jgi:hypothetical protein
VRRRFRDFVAQEPRHGRRERGLAGARRAVQQVAPAPGATFEEALEVGGSRRDL